MRTYTHGAIGYLLYAKRPRRERWLAAAGGVLPDLVLGMGYLFHAGERMAEHPWIAALHSLFHGELHWVTLSLHSLLLLIPLAAGLRLLERPETPLVVGMVAHGAVDFLTHGEWAYNHLFPLPLEPVTGPLSYTDPWFTVVEHGLFLTFVVWLVARGRGDEEKRGPNDRGER